MPGLKDLKKKLGSKARWQRWALVALVVAIVVRYFYMGILMFVVGCIVVVAITSIAGWIVRGSYKNRRQEPKKLLMSKRVQTITLADDEEFYYVSRQHFIAVLPWLAASLIIIVSSIALSFVNVYVGLVVLAIGLWVFSYKLLWWWYYRACVTNKRIIVIEGIVRYDNKQMQIDAIKDRRTSISILSKILCFLRIIEDDFGKRWLETSGQAQAFDSVDKLPFIGDFSQLVDSFHDEANEHEETKEVALLREIRDALNDPARRGHMPPF
jgi:hypothetical protein